MRKIFLALLAFCSLNSHAQDYFLENLQPYDPSIPSPEAFLGYGIGEYHTRHDRIVAYMEELARLSPKAELVDYGQTHEGRRLLMLIIGTPQNLARLEQIRKDHLQYTQPDARPTYDPSLPLIVNMGYNVHGNEPSSSEAAMLTAYTLLASQHPSIGKFLEEMVIFLDPVLNPDGRDRHTLWANMHRGINLVADAQDAEHNEFWPRGRTNHYWFDLNRDWLLGVQPEMRAKLNWYHQWYPNVVTDFHEQGTGSTYFFEPKSPYGTKEPLAPIENYEVLNESFAEYFASDLDSIGTLYFNNEVYDNSYPGYASTYPDMQGGLGLLFEQASSRGHVQTNGFGTMTFAFTIRNQYVSSIATLKAAVANKRNLREYQQRTFRSAVAEGNQSRVKGYYFEEDKDQTRLRAFLDKLLLHKIRVHRSGDGFVVPAAQKQGRLVKAYFNTQKEYRDSVFYDASSWSVANFYHMDYRPVTKLQLGEEVTSLDDFELPKAPVRSDYAYLIDYNEYSAPAFLYFLQNEGLRVTTAFRPFKANTTQGVRTFDRGTLMLPIYLQDKSAQEIYEILKRAHSQFHIPVYAVTDGYLKGEYNLGSRSNRSLTQPKVALLVGQGVSSYEAGEVWHLLDTRMHMPLSKLPLDLVGRADLDEYNTLVMVSGSYSSLDKKAVEKIKQWVNKGNTLITVASASSWAINKELVKESLVKKKVDSTATPERIPFEDARGIRGREEVGGTILKADLDLTHPLAFGYHRTQIPVYKNNNVWLAPSKNEFSTIAQYAEDAHIDGFITQENLDEFVSKSASLLVSKVGSGRVVMFADNPNFRGSWYGTNRLFLNAIFLGDLIRIP